MKKNVKLIALLLALALVFSALAGCTGTDEPATTESPSTSQPESSAASSETPAPSQDAPPPEVSQDMPPETEESPPSEEIAPPVEEKKTITYPLTDPNKPYEITLWCEFVSVFEQYIDSFNSMPLMPTILEATGVNYKYVEVSQAAATEQFNLMIVSQQWTDIIRAADYYVGGLTAAYNDGVLMDLTDLIPEYAPDYYEALMNTNQDTIDMVMTAGMYLQMNSLETTTIADKGMVARGDWLEGINMSAPQNLDEFTDALYALNTTYDTDKTFYLDYKGGIEYVNNAFGIGGFDVSGNSTSVAVARNGDTLYSELVSDGSRDYIEWFNKLYNDHIFQEDFYTNNDNENTQIANVANGDAAFWTGMADSIDRVTSITTDPDLKTLPCGVIYDDEGKFTYGQARTMADNKGYSITTSCEIPEIALSFYNYFFTEEGMILANYGKEGDTFEYVGGKPTYTDAIMNDPAYFAPFMAIVVKCFSQGPIYNDSLKLMDTYSDAALEAIGVWSDRTGVTVEHNIPNGASLTADQTNEIATTTSDIVAYSSETLLKFMTAASPPTDEEWEAYCAQCETLGLSKVVRVYQQAYDDYLTLKNG